MNVRGKWTRKKWPVLVVTASTLLTVGCTSSSDDADPTTAPTTEAAPATTQPAATTATDAPATSSSPSDEAVAEALSVEVVAGGPYTAAPGETVALAGSFAVTDQRETIDDLDAIGAALRAYHDANGSFPPAALLDPAGTPTLSWRVLLLPYLGEQALYDRFDLGASWDDATNSALLEEMPDVYRGAGQSADATDSGYAGVAGAKQLFRGPEASLAGGVRLADVIDADNMTIAVGPVGSGVALPWTAPGDLDLEQVDPTVGTPSGFDGVGSILTPMLFLDGTVRLIPDTTDSDLMHSWSTIAGGGCAPPQSLEVTVQGSWDLDGDGTFETAGGNASLIAGEAGTRTLHFRVFDGLGGVHDSVAELVVG